MNEQHPEFPYTLDDEGLPVAADGHPLEASVDDGGSAHWFDVTGQTGARELTYFRAIEQDGVLLHDQHPVMPWSDDPADGWALEGLSSFLSRGEVRMAQQLAYQVAQIHEVEFPDPAALPALNPDPEYYLGLGVTEKDEPALELVKTWVAGTERRFEALTISAYGSYEELTVDEREFNTILDRDGREAALHLAERMAVAGGFLDPQRDDPRLFFAADAPPDSFTTLRAMELAGSAPEREPPPAPDAGVERFRAAFADSPRELLEPLDGTVNYSFDLVPADPWTLELSATKWWFDPAGPVRLESQTLNTYPMQEGEVADAAEREIAAMDHEGLMRTYREQGLKAAMREAEGLAVVNRQIDRQREDGRLFRDGPPDRFTTEREAVLDAERAPFREVNPPDLTEEDTHPAPAIEPGSWDELVEQERTRLPEPEPAEAPAYWQIHLRPAQAPDGQPLGHAMFMTVFPELPPDFDRIVDEQGMDDTMYPSHARTLEMAHFATEREADRFEQDFRGYLVPGLLDGPDLAVEVARLEGLPVEWRAMDHAAIVEIMSGRSTVEREPEGWQVHEVEVEREIDSEADLGIGF